jgi:hypothetical protein
LKYLYLITVLALSSCAQIVAPTGGDRDSTPPAAIEDKTIPKNLSTNFNSNTILITFNEYFRFNNPNQNIVITPSLKEKPTYKVKGKKLYIFLNNKLEENTTYTINFGEAISDVTENNVLKNYKYVFSTGAFLDSLQLKGSVVDALSNKPSEDVWVMLYTNFVDSIPLKEKPYYFSKTNKNGQFEITHIKDGNYKLFALEDVNNNLIYDNPSENIGFLDTLISIDNDSIAPIKLYTFNERKEKFYAKKTTFNTNNSVSIVFSKPLDSVPKIEGDIIHHIYFKAGTDSCVVFLKDTLKGKIEWPISVAQYKYSDTIKARTKLPSEKVKGKINYKDIAPQAPISLRFNYPITQVNNEFIRVEKDSVAVEYTIEKNTADDRQLDLTLNTYETGEHSVTLLPNAITTLYQQTNDTLVDYFTVVKNDFFCVLSLTITTDVIPDFNLILELLDSKQEVIEKRIISAFGEVNTFTKLPPGNYSFRLIFDENNNGKWDTGSYFENRQPEKILNYSKPLSLRSNWEVNETWEIKLAD